MVHTVHEISMQAVTSSACSRFDFEFTDLPAKASLETCRLLIAESSSALFLPAKQFHHLIVAISPAIKISLRS